MLKNVTVRYILAIQDLPKKQQNHVHEFAGRASIARKVGKFSGVSCRSEPSVGISGWDHAVNRRGFGGLIGAAGAL